MKVAARGVAIDLGHLSLSTGSSKVTWNNRHRHLYHAFPQYEYASVTVLHTEITLLLRRRIMYVYRDRILYSLCHCGI